MRPEVWTAQCLKSVHRYRGGRRSCVEAAELLGISEPYFRRFRERERRRGRDRRKPAYRSPKSPILFWSSQSAAPSGPCACTQRCRPDALGAGDWIGSVSWKRR